MKMVTGHNPKKETTMRKILILLLVPFLALVAQVNAADVQTIGTDELKQQLGSSDVVVLDVRTGSDWAASDYMIKGAVRVDPSDVKSWADSHSRDKTYVLYCA